MQCRCIGCFTRRSFAKCRCIGSLVCRCIDWIVVAMDVYSEPTNFDVVDGDVMSVHEHKHATTLPTNHSYHKFWRATLHSSHTLHPTEPPRSTTTLRPPSDLRPPLTASYNNEGQVNTNTNQTTSLQGTIPPRQTATHVHRNRAIIHARRRRGGCRGGFIVQQ